MADKQIETPLPSQWDSAIIRNLAYAVLALIATVAADYFGVTSDVIKEKGGRLIEAVLTVLIVATPLFFAWRARLKKATPPITQEAAQAQIDRELAIATAVTHEDKTLAASGRATKQGGIVRIVFLALLLALSIPVLTIVSGCAGTQQAFSEAESLDEKAFVLLSLYEGAQREARDIVQNPTTPRGVVVQIQSLAPPALAASKTLRPAADAYKATRSASSEAELQRLYNDAVLSINDFVDAVDKARGNR